MLPSTSYRYVKELDDTIAETTQTRRDLEREGHERERALRHNSIALDNAGRAWPASWPLVDQGAMGQRRIHLASDYGNCCMEMLLGSQTDFHQRAENPWIKVVKSLGHGCIFRPKFHCELNIIEYYLLFIRSRVKSYPSRTARW